MFSVVVQIFLFSSMGVMFILLILNNRLLKRYIRMVKEQKTFKDNAYSLNQTEYENMKQLGSTTIKFSSTNGIGVKVECWDGTDWVDITDYSCW